MNLSNTANLSGATQPLRADPNLKTGTTFSYKDVMVRKLVNAVALSVVSQLLILIFYAVLVNVTIFHPVEWLTSTVKIFTHFSTLLFVTMFLSIIFAQCLICAKDYVLMSSYCSTRFQQFLQIFSLHNVTLLFLYVLVGGLLTWQMLSLSTDSNSQLIVDCDAQRYCLNLDVFFLIFGGFSVGFYYFLKVYTGGKHLIFPVVQQTKFLQFRFNISTILKESFTQSVRPTVYLTVFYLFFGSYVEDRFMSAFSLTKLPIEGSFLVYVYAWWYSSLFFFSMNLMRFFFYLFLTESVQFPLVKLNEYTLTLQEALVMDNLPIVQNLACLDLFLLSRWDYGRRQIFFTLSQPGNHPNNWNFLVENLLKLIKDYTDLLKRSTDVETAAPKVVTQMPFSPIQDVDNMRYRSLRNMSYTCEEYVDVVDVTQNAPFSNDLKRLRKKFDDTLAKILNVVKIILGINFLFGELPQANIQKCLSNGRLIICASQGISQLLAASLIEDKYGVAHKDLPVILTTLVELKRNLDKLNKIPSLTRKIATLDGFNYRMKNALSAAVKRSLVNICIGFGDYFHNFALSKDVLVYLQSNVMLRN